MLRVPRLRLVHILTGPAMACFLVVLLALQGHGQEHKSIQRVGMPHDWTHRHVVFSHSTSPELDQAVKLDPRFAHQQMRLKISLGQHGPHHWDRRGIDDEDKDEDARDKRGRHTRKGKAVDWSVVLAGPMAAGMFPAKYTFNVDATPSCANDFVVFALNVNGSTTAANIIAYNNLYTEPGGTGLCPGTGPTVMWAYNAGSSITTSPVLSLDGTKVAWAASSPAVFHVLTIGTTGNNGTAPILPAVPGVGNNAVDTTIPYSVHGNLRSSVFEDYDDDVAYAGSNDGLIHKFSGVFHGIPAEVTTGWPIQDLLGSSQIPTGPVFDSVSRNIFFADSFGSLSFIREVGSTKGSCNGGVQPPCIGNSFISLTNTTTAITDAPIVDSTTQRVFAFAPTNNTNTQAFVFQTDTAFGPSNKQTPVGHNGNSLHIGDFDSSYFSTPATGFLYVCGYAAAAANPTLYRIGFDSVGNMNTTTDGNSHLLASPLIGTAECSPLTEIFNTPTAKDWLFGSVTSGCLASGGGGPLGCIMSFDITSGFPATASHATQTVGGTSGIVVDNVSTSPQASSIYFVDSCSVAGGACGVKLTQAGLQ